MALTRTHKGNDKDHAGLAAGTAAPQEYLPRYFAKSGHVDSDPKKTKKNGGGKGNWGGAGEEMVDGNFNFTNARRRSNSSGYSNGLKDFKTKFEVMDPEPVFEDHMAESEEDLSKTDSTESVDGGSAYDEGEAPKPAEN